MPQQDSSGRVWEQVLLPRQADEETRQVLEGVGLDWSWEGVEKYDPLRGEWRATLPDGWRQVFVGEGLRRWCYLVDNKGQRRVSVNTSYSNQELKALHRFGVKTHRMFPNSGSVVFGIVLDYGAPLNTDETGRYNLGHVLHTTEAVPFPVELVSFEPESKAEQLAWNWLDQNYPDWRNPASYWD